MSTDGRGAAALRCLSSMATRGLLAELTAAHAGRSGIPVDLVSLGGVEAARRVRSGEAADVVVLAAGPMAALEGEGLLVAGSVRPVARSAMAAAVPAGAPRPDIGSADALRRALAGTGRIACSTGPSGDHLLALLARWGVEAEREGRLVRAAPGVPVAALLARGEADLGVQQASELLGAPGIALLGALPPEAQNVTSFSAGIAALSSAEAAARNLVAFLASAESDAIKARHGLEPA